MIIDVNDDDFIALASSSADALYSKTRNFNQAKQCTPRLDYFHAVSTPTL